MLLYYGICAISVFGLRAVSKIRAGLYLYCRRTPNQRFGRLSISPARRIKDTGRALKKEMRKFASLSIPLLIQISYLFCHCVVMQFFCVVPFFDDFWDNFVQVSNDTEVSYFEDRSIWVFVDSNNDIRCLHTC